MSLSGCECESGLSVGEQELLSKVEKVACWLKDSSDEEIISIIRARLGYYRAIGCGDYITKKEIDNTIKFYLNTKRRLDSCGGEDEEWQKIIQELFAFELELQKSSSKKEQAFEKLKESCLSNGCSDVDLSDGNITAIRDSNKGEKSYLEYLRGEVLSNFDEICEQTAAFTFGWGVLTLAIPAAFCKGVLNGLITLSIFFAIFASLNVINYHSLWKDLLAKNKEVEELFRNLDIYDEVLGYLVELNVFENLQRRSILRHVKS